MSVVNGAQTVGMIGSVTETLGHAPEPARILVRLISLKDCPDGFDKSVTRATNTQNRIERRDFAALDPNQQRLASEFLLDGKIYAFRSGDADPDPSQGCTLADATVALACASEDVGLAVQAKREIGRLWEDIDGPPYTTLFNDRTTATGVWRAVEIMRVVDNELKELASSDQPRAGMVAVHGNRLVLHRVFQAPRVKRFRAESVDIEEVKADIPAIAEEVFAALAGYLEANHPNAYLASLFKNLSKCRDADEHLEAGPTGEPAAPHSNGTQDSPPATPQRELFDL